jgi:tetratricopeptide (TPR) repeat protein
MHRFLLPLLLATCVVASAQSSPAGNASSSNSSSPTGSSQSSTQAPDSGAPAKPAAPHTPNLAPPRSDRVDADSLPADGDSSSKDSQIDLSPPANDDKAHPNSPGILMDEGSGSVGEIHAWDPHKASKDVEVGDFYFKRGNFRAAEDRYREALLFKPNDAIATFRLAESLEKLDRPAEAREGYESYLKMLPDGPEAKKAKKALDRLNENSKSPSANAKPAQ